MDEQVFAVSEGYTGPVSVVMKEGTLEVVKQFTQRGAVVDEQSADHALFVREFKTNPARVGVDFSKTINLGDYNGVKINVSASVPCYVEELDDAYAWLRDKVAGWMAKETRPFRKGE